MFKIGENQSLVIDHIAAIGPYLADPGDMKNRKDTVLLPKKEMPRDAKPGDLLDVFVYRDSGDRLIATLRQPKIKMGEIRPLKVAAITRVGAFMDWGLEKDVLLPYSEQITKVQIGREYLVQLYEDKSGRLCVTMKVYPKLSCDSPYKEGDKVSGYVYQINPEMGAFVAIDNKYHGMVPIKEMLRADLHCGDTINARVSQVRKRDGKLIITPNRKAYREISKDAAKVYNMLEAAGGALPYNDHSSPAQIYEAFHMSKAAFKRAVGNLMKLEKVRITSRGIVTARWQGKETTAQKIIAKKDFRRSNGVRASKKTHADR